MLDDRTILLGVDGGATGIRCHEVRRLNSGTFETFALGAASAEADYPVLSGFSPVAPDRQRRELDAGPLQIDGVEDEQGSAWIDTAAAVIVRVASESNAERVRVGIGMPGIKSDDERGIVMINNGPRMPQFLDRLTDRLTQYGVTLEQPIRRIGDDSTYCGLGEEHAAGGLFRDVENGYYIGGGTGIAECFKIDGHVMPLNDRGCNHPRAWELATPIGLTYEKLISAASMNAVYQKLSPLSEQGRDRFPELDAERGDPIAISWLRFAALLLAHLVCERLTSLLSGPSSGKPSVYLERIIIGQRLGQLYGTTRLRPFFADHVESMLAELIRGHANEAMLRELGAYLDGENLRRVLIVASELRAAPAIGAVVDALSD